MNRVGIGYDIHRFAEGRSLILGGVAIASELGLEGHSDADVLCHAIADALLGAAGLPDIGYHFPNTDASIQGISSLVILERVRELVADAGGVLVNVDSTLIAERPKILPHLEAMRERIGSALGVPSRRVGIKATTNEKLGAIGRAEGIAAMAVASVQFPD
jgi:2-C-methyl-D-erythritol 2,4-cyclodiphosphate synthase